jgi:hypothetical protein
MNAGVGHGRQGVISNVALTILLVVQAPQVLHASVRSDLRDATREAAESNHERAWQIVQPLIVTDSTRDRRRILEFFHENQATKDWLHLALLAQARSLGEPDSLERMVQLLDSIKRVGGISYADAAGVRMAGRQALRALVVSGLAQAEFGSRWDAVLLSTHGLDADPEVMTAFAIATLDAQRRGRFSQHVTERLLLAAGLDPAARVLLEPDLGRLNLTRSLIETEMAAIYPRRAAEQLDEITFAIYIVFLERTAILHLLKEELAERDEFILVESEQEAEFLVEIEDLGLESFQGSPVSETITYQRYQVAFVGALLSMPDYSTYQFEYESGSTEVTYAFSVMITALEGSGDANLGMIDGSIDRSWSRCGSARITNAFGGQLRADFTANDDMRRRCRDQGGPANPRDLRREVVQEAARRLVSLVGSTESPEDNEAEIPLDDDVAVMSPAELYRHALRLWEGTGTEQNRPEALRLMRHASEAGHLGATRFVRAVELQLNDG